jgi:hypothetical protein
VRESKRPRIFDCTAAIDAGLSDYKDDGTNILLDANENAYGPGLALTQDGSLNGHSNSNGHIKVDLLGLNRYPDPYVTLALRFLQTYTNAMNSVTNTTLSSYSAHSATHMHTRTKLLPRTTCSSALVLTKPLTISCVVSAHLVATRY